MMKLGLALAAAVIATGSASAADLMYRKAPPAPVVAPFSWEGFYIGVNGGGAFGHSRHSFPGAGTTTGNFDISGGLVGGTLGYNFQSSGMVFGLEGDFDWARITGETACPNAAFTCRTEGRWLSTVRGRIGYTAGTVLPYITGGLALGDIRMSTFPFVPGVESDTRAGWTIGAGLEVALNQNWSVKAEYLYVDLGRGQCSLLTCDPVSVDNVRFTSHIVRGGINYRFNWGGPVVASY
jgi:outer membrane immunogenic protein